MDLQGWGSEINSPDPAQPKKKSDPDRTFTFEMK